MEQELGVPWEDVFEHIEPEPLAAGTIGQVHRARLDGGQRVVIKVQRPGAAEEIERDLGLLALFAEKAEGREALAASSTSRPSSSTSPRRSAASSTSARRRRTSSGCARSSPLLAALRAVGAQAAVDRAAARDGRGRRRAAPRGAAGRAPGARPRSSCSRPSTGRCCARASSTPTRTPGNLLWADDQIHLLDLGMTGSLEDDARELLLLLLLAFWRGDSGFLADVLLMLGEARGDVDIEALRADLRGLDRALPGQLVRRDRSRPDARRDDRDRDPARRAAAGGARDDRQGVRPDAARGRGARPRSRPVRGRRAVHVQAAPRQPARFARPAAGRLRGPEAEAPRLEADRGDRAHHRRAARAGPPDRAAREPDARGRDPPCRAPDRARLREAERRCSRPCSPLRRTRSIRGCRSRSASVPAWPDLCWSPTS